MVKWIKTKWAVENQEQHYLSNSLLRLVVPSIYQIWHKIPNLNEDLMQQGMKIEPIKTK